MVDIKFTQESRLDLIYLAIEKVKAKKYLEIGCFKDKVFNSIPVDYKIGVDPQRGGNRRMTSDEFFTQNTDTFDVIFIDGLHHYDQVSRDFENSLSCLNDGGIIILHDMLPLSEEEAVVPIPEKLPYTWVGDVWRLAFDLSNRTDVTFKLTLIDNGCGVVYKKSQIPLSLPIGNDWNFYSQNYSKLPMVTYSEIVQEIETYASVVA